MHMIAPLPVLAVAVFVVLLAALGFATLVAALARRTSRGAGVGCLAAVLVGLGLFVLLACMAGMAAGLVGYRRAAYRGVLRASQAQMAARKAEMRARQSEAAAKTGQSDELPADGAETPDPDASPDAIPLDEDEAPVEAGDSDAEAAKAKKPRGGKKKSGGQEGKGAKEAESPDSLSVAPEGPAGGVVIPPGRPSWVESAPVREGKVHQTAVSSGLQPRPRECRIELDKQLKAAADEYINWYLGRENAAAWLGYRLPHIRSNLLRPENVYDEVIQVSFGPMHQSHALLEFDESFRRELDDRWRRVRAGVRLLQTGLASALVLALVTTLFGYFRLDTATRGFYSRRLQLAASAAILAWIAVAVLLARKIPWI